MEKENKMGTMPLNRLLITVSLPMMISMLVTAAYNIVDSFFVAQISENALTAVSMAFPIQQIMMGLAFGVGIGVNALLSRALGEKEFDQVNNYAMHGIFLSLCSYIVFAIVGFNVVKPFYRVQTTDAEIIEYGIQYLSTVCICSFGMYAQLIFERLLQSTGRTVCTMITQGTGAIINIVLDPIFIFGLFGAPKLGVRGAAIATVIGQIIAATMAVIMNITINKEVKLSFKGFKVSKDIIGKIYAIGTPSILMQSVGSIMVFCMNKILIGFTSTAVAIFGVYFKLQSFVFMPVFGLNNGMVPIVAYNYGAKRKDRMVGTIKLAVMYAIIIMTTGLVIFQIVPDKLLSIFNASDDMLAMGVVALKIISTHFPVAAFCIILGSVFQALGKGWYTLITSIMRQVVVLIPVAYLLSLTGNVDNVWWSFPIAEVMSFLVTLVCMVKTNKDIISKIGNEVATEVA